MPDDVAVFTEPVAAAFQIPVQVTDRRTDRVVVLGDGRLGNLCAQVLAHGCRTTCCVVGKHPEKLALLTSLGIATALLSDPIERARRHRRRLHGLGDRAADRAEARAPARHDRAEDDRRRHADAGVGAVCDRRGDAGGFAVRAVRSGAGRARAGPQ